MDGHSGHSNFIKKCLEYNIVNSKDVNTYIGNNRQKTVSTMSKQIISVENQGNRKDIDYDSQINWPVFNYNQDHPTKTARVRPIWRGVTTKILPSITGTITIDLPGRTREEAIKHLDVSRYEFYEWAW